MSNTVISVENLTKRYDLGVIGTGTLSRDLTRWWARLRGNSDPYTHIGQKDHFERTGESILALDDISFKVDQGQALGIIGKNGAGKSTLLKVLSRVTAPTSGVVKVKGRIGSLLEVGTGFHPELTGRENIFLNGAILGMNKSEVQKKFDEIVDFSGVEKFIDTPVKRYSSGMYVRLAFAVAAHLDPEILVVDEVLAVGDAEFQKKCLGKMGDVAGEGRTVLFVSHNMTAIQHLCPKAILLNKGIVEMTSSSQEVITYYLNKTSHILKIKNLLEDRDQNTLNAYYTKINLRQRNNSNLSVLINGEPLEIILEYVSKNTRAHLDFAIGIYNIIGEKLLHLDSRYAQNEYETFLLNGKINCYIPKFPLPNGSYKINLALFVDGITEDHITDAIIFDVKNGNYYGTGKLPNSKYQKFLIDHTWKSSQ